MAKNIFNSIKLSKPKSNVFDLSHDVKLSMKMGDLVPVMCMECIPGDKVNIAAEALTRFAPMVAPVMHRFDQTIHYFFVPHRLLWQNWEKFITNTPLNETNLLPAFPTVNITTANYSKLADYLGIPIPITGQTETVSVLPFVAYMKVWYEYYRDQNLRQDEWPEVSDGLMDPAYFNLWFNTLKKRCWEHDYFTSALPFAQKGPAVDLPIAGETPVYINQAYNEPGEIGAYWNGNMLTSGDPLQPFVENKEAEDPDIDTRQLFVDLGDTNSTTINDLRRAFKLQEWLEKMARGGSRYIEQILSHFGVKSSDARLQRPEYITGVKSPIVISEVLNTTGTTELPQGNMSGHALSVADGKFGSYYCEEHGYIIGIMSVMPKTAYQQGIPKHFLKYQDPFQYYWPSFAHIGEQEILNKELYAFQGASGNETFGYTPRYAEYRFELNRVAGDFRTNLDFWHASRIFDTVPNLNADFVESNPTNRIFAVEDENVDKLYCHVFNKVTAVRKIPKFGTPMM